MAVWFLCLSLGLCVTMRQCCCARECLILLYLSRPVKLLFSFANSHVSAWFAVTSLSNSFLTRTAEFSFSLASSISLEHRSKFLHAHSFFFLSFVESNSRTYKHTRYQVCLMFQESAGERKKHLKQLRKFMDEQKVDERIPPSIKWGSIPKRKIELAVTELVKASDLRKVIFWQSAPVVADAHFRESENRSSKLPLPIRLQHFSTPCSWNFSITPNFSHFGIALQPIPGYFSRRISPLESAGVGTTTHPTLMWWCWCSPVSKCWCVEVAALKLSPHHHPRVRGGVVRNSLFEIKKVFTI